MSNGKQMFKSEANHLRKLSHYFSMSMKKNGSQVILCESNQKILLEASDKLIEVSKLLEKII